jgi:hypothetical protein
MNPESATDEIVTAVEEHGGRVVDILAEAFRDDPVLTW